MQLQIINTKDGSQTLYIAEMDEQYHSTNGAITESNYVYIEKGYMFNKSKNTTIFEVGFGTGLNCLLTALFAEKQKRHTIYYTIEKYPLDKEIIKQLKYGKNISAEAQVLFENMASQGIFIIPIMIYHALQLIIISFIAQKMGKEIKE